MAQVPKVYSLAPTAPSAPARGVPTARGGVSTSTASPISEASASEATSFEAAPFGLHGQSYRQPDFREGASQHRQTPGTLVNISSETFSILLESNGGGVENGALSGDVRGRRYSGSVSNAIKTYETNARVIHGEPPVTGTEISIRL